MKKAIIFDLEGVIVDTEPLWSRADEEFLKRHNLPFTNYEIDWKPKLMGRNLVEGATMFRDCFEIVETAEELAKQRREIARELFISELKFITGFETFFVATSTKYKMGVATSLERSFLASIDSRIGLSTMFDNHVYSAEDIGFISKPNPGIFLHAAKKLGVKHFDCIVVEDSPLGIEAAKRAGMRCIAITTSTTRDRLSHADFIVDAYSEIDVSFLS